MWQKESMANDFIMKKLVFKLLAKLEQLSELFTIGKIFHAI